jgi:type VI secretion system protein ImpH
MATESRGADPALEREIFERGYQFDFFQAVWVLHRMFPHRKAVGTSGPPASEAVRFNAFLSLSFPPSSIRQIAASKREDRPSEMTVAFIGLTGPQGVLPRHYTELLMERVAAKDYALRDFLNLFNHRITSFFYRAWEKHRCLVGFERGLSGATPDRLSKYFWSLMGLGTGGIREQLSGVDRVLLRYVGAIAQKPKSANALQQVLSDYFKVPVSIQQFLGRWLVLEEEDWTRLGARGSNNQLGQTTVLGTKAWDQQAKFKVHVGPMSYSEFSNLLPSGHAYPVLVNLVKFFAGPDLDFDVNLICNREQVPVCRLRESESYTPRLGWTTWLKTKETVQHADQVLFSGTARHDSLVLDTA